jgi:hypothetical protein
MINTYSQFFYGFQITEDNRYLDFNDDTPMTAELVVGDYTATTILAEIKRAMDEVGSQAYTVTMNRTTRKITIAATSNFSLLVSSGNTADTSVFGLLGFTGSDRTSANTYTGDEEAGYCFEPQCKLQSYLDPNDNEEKISATVNEAANGDCEVVYFGTKRRIEMNIDWVTNTPMPTGFSIKDNRTALTDLRAFMANAICKYKMEFMPDLSSPSTFYTVILESTPESSSGVAFKIKEKYDAKMPGFYSTGALKFRVV